MKELLIVLLNWNSNDKTLHCIQSLLQSSYSEFDIIVVDNASKDGSREQIELVYPDIQIIKNTYNAGFCHANNQALQYGLIREYKYFLLLNNDLLVDKDLLHNLILQAKQKAKAGIVGGKIHFLENRNILNSTGIEMNFYGYAWDRDFGIPVEKLSRKEGPCLAVSGACMLIKRETLETIGFLDETFFAYFEDLEYCCRLQKKTDFEVWYIDSAIAYHEFSASTKKLPFLKYRLLNRNYWINMSKTFPMRLLCKYTIPIIYTRLRYEAYHRLKTGSWLYFCTEIFYLLMFPYYFFRYSLKESFQKNSYSYIRYLYRERTFHRHKEVQSETC